jgi:hypothetical protein
MAKYAVLNDKKIVENVIIADSLETANTVVVPNECIAIGEGKISDYWNGTIFVSVGEEGYPTV